MTPCRYPNLDLLSCITAIGNKTPPLRYELGDPKSGIQRKSRLGEGGGVLLPVHFATQSCGITPKGINSILDRQAEISGRGSAKISFSEGGGLLLRGEVSGFWVAQFVSKGGGGYSQLQ